VKITYFITKHLELLVGAVSRAGLKGRETWCNFYWRGPMT